MGVSEKKEKSRRVAQFVLERIVGVGSRGQGKLCLKSIYPRSMLFPLGKRELEIDVVVVVSSQGIASSVSSCTTDK